MGWMSINQFKRRYGFGKGNGEPVPDYEQFFVVKTEKGEVKLDAKKRYIRILTHPDTAAVLLSKKDARSMAKAIEAKIETAIEKKAAKIKKDGNGLKFYADFKDGQGIRVMLREADTDHVFIETSGIPHLRAQDSEELVLGLRAFSKNGL